MDPELLQRAHSAFCDDDATQVRELLAQHPELRTLVNEPDKDAFDAPAVTRVRSRAMLDVLLGAGADINAKSKWWAGGFGLLHNADPELARYAIERGAHVDIHAAARLGLIDRVRELVAADPARVHARGGDGQTPLHFASTREVAEFLLDHGADIDARDIDHESTPAQYMLGERQELARFLVSRGCTTDIFMAAALGDLDLARKHLQADPDCIRMRVSEEWFPMVGGKCGGTIYQWVLGWHVSPHQVAKKFGHDEVFRFLMERSPEEVRLLNFAWVGDAAAVEQLLAANPEIAKTFRPPELRQLAHAARNNDTNAVRHLLKIGLPVTARGQHNATPLHWAAWHGNLEALQLILRHNPELEDNQNEFEGTPLRWAIHGSENGWYCKTGDYPGVVQALLRVGAKRPKEPGGTPAVREVLSRAR